MPSKKERIQYLESEVVGLHNKLSEVIGELEALKKQVANAWLIPPTNPVNVPSIFPDLPSLFPNSPTILPFNSGFGHCASCGQYYFPSMGHVCPNAYKITVTSKTGAEHP
jgi:hypothetical protein